MNSYIDISDLIYDFTYLIFNLENLEYADNYPTYYENDNFVTNIWKKEVFKIMI